MIRVKEELTRLADKFDFLNCIETGTIRTYTEKHESTRHISELIGENGRLKSIDIEQKSLDISKDICKNATNVEWILSDSIEYLKKDNDEYHFVLLDSVNDADHIFEEFKLVAKRIHAGGVLIIDDAGVGLDKNSLINQPPSILQPAIATIHTPRKAVQVNAFLSSIGADYDIVVGGHPGHQLLLKMTQKNIQRIEDSL